MSSLFQQKVLEMSYHLNPASLLLSLIWISADFLNLQVKLQITGEALLAQLFTDRGLKAIGGLLLGYSSKVKVKSTLHLKIAKAEAKPITSSLSLITFPILSAYSSPHTTEHIIADLKDLGLATINASVLGYNEQKLLPRMWFLKQLTSPQHICLQFLFSSPKGQWFIASHTGLTERAGAKPKDCSLEALLSITHLRCAFLGENETVHMSHGHHVQYRAPGVAQRASDQRSEVESQEVQVILRRGSVALKRHRKLQQTHPGNITIFVRA